MFRLFGRLRLLCFRIRQLCDTLEHLDGIEALFEGDASFKIAPTSEAAEFCAEGFVFYAPFGTSKRLASAFVAQKEHFLSVDVGIAKIVDVVVFEGDLLIEAIVADVGMALKQFGIIASVSARWRSPSSKPIPS